MPSRPNRLSVMFKPVLACNLRCRYCYAERERDGAAPSMGMDELRVAFQWLLAYCREGGFGSVQVVWHGGEPTLPGHAYLEEAVLFYETLFRDAGIQVSSGIQTNLARLDDGLLAVLRDHFGASVGVSMDWNTGARVWPNGRDSTPDVAGNVARLKRAGVKVTAISAVSAANVGDPVGMYRYFKGLGLPFRSNRIFPNGTAGSDAGAAGVSAQDYAAFVNGLADAMLSDPEPHVARTACDYILAYLRDGASLCCLSEDCTKSFLCLAPGGAVYPCSRFDDASERVGDFLHDDVSAVRARLRAFTADSPLDDPASRAKRLDECRSCTWLPMCHSGCLHSRKTGWLEEECAANRLIWGHLASVLGKMGIPRGFLRDALADEAAETFLNALAGGNAGGAGSKQDGKDKDHGFRK